MNTHHRINYIEFHAVDLTKIKEFYTQVFGWQFTDYGPDYVAFNDGALEGGFAKGEIQKQSGPLVILYSTDLAASSDAVTKYGGKIIKPTYEFPGGKRFHFTDPAGNELAVWSEK